MRFAPSLRLIAPNAAAAALLCGAAATAFSSPPEAGKAPASSPTPAAAASPLPPEAELRAKGLDTTAVQVEQLGFLMYPPAACLLHRENVGSSVAVVLTDSEASPTWRLRIQPLRSQLPQPTAEAIAREHLGQIQASDQAARVLENAIVRTAGVEGWRLTIQQGPPQGPLSECVVSSWLILPTGYDTFLVLALLSAGDAYQTLHPLFDNSFSTIRLQSVAGVNDTRSARLEAGRALLQSLSPERLRSLTGKAQWLRVYKSSSGGDREVGYSVVEVNDGKRGSLTEKKAEADYTPLEREPGLVVSVRARLALDSERASYADSIQTYWMAWDQSEEAWSVRATRQQGEAAASEAETGIRTRATPDGPTGKITVDRRDTLTARHDPFEWVVPDVYLSQSEHWILGHLLPRDQTGPREFAYYYYQPRRVEISLRVDRWMRSDDGSGNWVLITRLNPDEEPSTTTYDAQGNLVRQVRSDGTIVVPSTPDQIRRLWESQGLKWGGAR